MLFAMYVPKPVYLAQVLVMLSVIWLILCWCAWRLRLRLRIATPVLLGSGLLAIFPDLVKVLAGSAVHSDGLLITLTGYMHAGRGGWLAVVGMLCGLTVHVIPVRVFACGRAETDTTPEY